jgi:hypothetical protein
MLLQRFHTIAVLKCPHCGVEGAAVWESVEDQSAGRRLVNLRGQFHSETGRTNSGELLIICTECDEIQGN